MSKKLGTINTCFENLSGQVDEKKLILGKSNQRTGCKLYYVLKLYTPTLQTGESRVNNLTLAEHLHFCIFEFLHICIFVFLHIMHFEMSVL